MRCLAASLVAGCATSNPPMRVVVPIADLRTQPHTVAQPAIHDPLEETQLLYGERVRVLSEKDGWSKIEAIEQPEFSHANRWQGYPGWVPSSALAPDTDEPAPNIVVTDAWAAAWTNAYATTPSLRRFPMGARLYATDMAQQLWRIDLADGEDVWISHNCARKLDALHALSPIDRRRMIIRNAEQLLGDPYYWGGRSPRAHPPSETVTGVDCSGLVNLTYRTAGVDIPRDAHEQWLRARRIHTPQPADLIFLSERNNPRHIVHVMLYAGDGAVIEGPATGTVVRRINFAERLGRSLDQVPSGTLIDGQTVSYGSYLP